MSRVVEFETAEIMPAPDDILRDQGVAEPAAVSDRIMGMLDESVERFERAARPIGIMSELTVEEFRPIFEGAGDNAPDVLLERIYPHADNIALFALTVGEEVSRCIEELFSANEFAQGSMLDSVASLAADAASVVLEARFLEELKARRLASSDHLVLGYSPGYCGWYITGQRKIFEFLNPEQIGITLSESCLMTPLKSITGLLVSAGREIHIFDPSFGYCKTCKHRSCTERLERLSINTPRVSERRHP